MTDLVLAVLHHLAVFTLFGVLVSQFVIVSAMPDEGRTKTLARVDLGYGLTAAIILIVGGCRVAFADKGWTFYAHNTAFWAKMAVFAGVGLISIYPTLTFRRWTRAGAVSKREIARVKSVIVIELALFALLPVLAAMMARGVGEF
ncbi:MULTISPECIES: DUF2214 family protein [Bradyrhizobium]|uniref:DUF2214 family protein n=1 Tax=Bradyrhizobium TaxID=374 RepID=UPI0004B3BAB9|nr:MULTISPECIES: DUF2214 family protein [Bradyrhizobium]MBR0945523.1 DUF2214 family protein [Bradyrhizobium liaoningense]MDI2074460.1 DUF2214 family protein [Bradyrhizobium sp. Mp27]